MWLFSFRLQTFFYVLTQYLWHLLILLLELLLSTVCFAFSTFSLALDYFFLLYIILLVPTCICTRVTSIYCVNTFQNSFTFNCLNLFLCLLPLLCSASFFLHLLHFCVSNLLSNDVIKNSWKGDVIARACSLDL